MPRATGSNLPPSERTSDALIIELLTEIRDILAMGFNFRDPDVEMPDKPPPITRTMGTMSYPTGPTGSNNESTRMMDRTRKAEATFGGGTGHNR